MGKKLNSTHYGELDINGILIPCYVLEDGRRVLSGRGMQSALELGQSRGRKIPDMVGNKAFKTLINNELELGIFSPIIFITNKGFSANGYEATMLVEVCDMLLQARKLGILPSRYEETTHQAEILTRSFAKLGIIALVDEATGYQYDREKNELQKILKQYISAELLPWQKKFPDIFYKELFRLNGWDFTVKGIKKRPGVVGTWTKKLIYEQLPKGVHEELRKSTPKTSTGKLAARLHQSLSTDVGNPHLEAQINQIVTLFQLSDNMEHMWQQFEKLKLRQSGQLELPFEFDDKGHTVSDEAEIVQIPPTEFNKNLKTALNYNPREEEE